MECVVWLLSLLDSSEADKTVRQLNSPAYEQRCIADKHLRSMGAGSLASVERGAKNPDPEIRSRCKAILDDYLSIGPEPPWFYDFALHQEDAYYSGYSILRYVYLQRQAINNCNLSYCGGVSADVYYREMTRLHCVQLLRLGVPRSWVNNWVRELKKVEDKWIRQYRNGQS